MTVAISSERAIGRSVGVFGSLQGMPSVPGRSCIEIDGHPVAVGQHPARRPAFDPTAPAHQHSVLIRVRAFSCNYRDKAFMDLTRQFPANRYFPLGSEFCAEVLETGDAVTTVRPGDRVFGQGAYRGPHEDADGVKPGVPTNKASCEYHVFHERKLALVPHTMSDAEAACFALNAQTAFSLVRRVDVGVGSRVLVTAGTSNTSLAAILAAQATGADVYTFTTSADKVEPLRRLGVTEVLLRRRDIPLHEDTATINWALEREGFDAVIDPFFDVHAVGALGMLRPGGRYATCGVAAQTELTRAQAAPSLPADNLLMVALIKNLVLHGNCLGHEADLANASDAFAAGRFRVVLDSIYSDGQEGDFLDRTFRAPDRFGKVAFVYADD